MKSDDSLVTMMLLSISIFLLIMFGVIAYMGYMMAELSFDIASKATGDSTQMPFVTLGTISDSEEKCFQISNDYTIPDDGKLYVSLGTNKIIAKFRSNYWLACFDKSFSGDLLVEGKFAKSDRQFGPYVNEWAEGTVELGEWRVTSSSNSLVGVVINPNDSSLPINLEQFQEDKKLISRVSVTGKDNDSLIVENSKSVESRFFVVDPFGSESAIEYAYVDGLRITKSLGVSDLIIRISDF